MKIYARLLLCAVLCIVASCTLQNANPRAAYDDQDSAATVDGGTDVKVQSLCQLDPETGMCMVNVENVPPGDVPETSGPLLNQGYDVSRTYCLSGGGQTVCCSTYTPTGIAGSCCRSSTWSVSCFPAGNVYDYLHLPY